MKVNVKLLNRKEIANGTMAFYFEKPEGFEFRAGQFADFTLLNPPETDNEGNTRGFSLANAPFEQQLMVATRLRDTAFKRVLKDLPIGSELELDAPYGDFTLQKNESKPAVFLIGGIGVTPVRSMIAQATQDKTNHKITLLHANKTHGDAPFESDFKSLANNNPNFSYVSVLSDEPDAKDAEHGRINEEILRRHVTDLNAPIYYLAGPEGMVKAMRQLLVSLNIDEDNIKTEEFTGY